MLKIQQKPSQIEKDTDDLFQTGQMLKVRMKVEHFVVFCQGENYATMEAWSGGNRECRCEKCHMCRAYLSLSRIT